MMCSINILVFFFKQKTAYEMRISDWSSDVCSSDLRLEEQGYKREKDVLAYLYDTEQDMHVAVRRLIDRPLPANVTLRHVDLKRLRAEVDAIRSEERPVGQECVSTCSSRWSPHNYKKQHRHGSNSILQSTKTH